MSRKRTHRKAKTGMTWSDTIVASQPFAPAEATTIMIRLNDAFGQMAAGTSDSDMFDVLAAAVNVGLVRCEEIGRAGEDVFLAAQRALMEADGIQGRHGRYGFTGPGLAAMREAIALYEQILRASTPLQMHKALGECIRRIQAGHVERAAA